MTSRTDGPPTARDLASADLVVVGAGIVGLAHAVHAVRRGASVVVVERDERALGASIRNFGHGCVTGQAGVALDYALEARSEWIRLAKEADFWLRDAGTVVVARAEDELAVLADFAAARGSQQVVLLDPAELRSRVPVGDEALGGAWLPLDLRVDPREAMAAIARWLTDQGVRFAWSTAVHGLEPTPGDRIDVRTSRGVVRAGRVVVAVGHDVDRLYPEVATGAGLLRCRLHMLEVANPSGRPIEPAVLTGTSMLRYDGFAVSPALTTLRQRLTATAAGDLDAGLNLMFTQRPDGALVIGDTHDYALSAVPFQDEAKDRLVLERTAHLLGVTELTVLRRWQGVYASAADPFLISTPQPGVRIVSVTSGIGMTTALGLAPTVLDGLLD